MTPLYVLTPLRADSFAMGALLAVGYRPSLWVCGIGAALATAPVMVGLQETGLVLMSGYVVALAVRPSWIGSALAWYPLPWLGTISYGVYIWHPVFFAEGWSFPVVSLATIVVATAQYGLVEYPVLRRSWMTTKERDPVNTADASVIR